MNSLAVEAGSSVAVFGTGSVGLAAVMTARIVGTNPIIAVDIHPRRLDLARELGATHGILNRNIDLAVRLRAIANGGMDHLIGRPATPHCVVSPSTSSIPADAWRC